MTVRTIIRHPNKILRRTAEPVNTVNDGIRQLISDMFHTMKAHNGIGLAAPQIGVGKCIIVINIPERVDDENSEYPVVQLTSALGDIQLTLINPEIIERSDEVITAEEGCLSLPSIFEEGPVRNKVVKFRALDQGGNEYEMCAEGLFSICIQHEIDHLSGKLFIDHLSNLKQTRIVKKLKKQGR